MITPKLALNFATWMSFFLLDFNTYTRDPHKNLIKKNEFNNHKFTPKHVVDLSVELGVSLDFLLVFIHFINRGSGPWSNAPTNI